MNKVPSLLMVTWNRREYLEKTLANLMRDSSDFNLYFWDNGSKDGVKDIINDLRDDRIVVKWYNKSNVGQFEPWHWFLNNCREDIAGKIDDDMLAKHGWMTEFSAIIADNPKIGVLGGWVFLPSDWDESKARHKFVRVGEHTIFQNGWVAGAIFLGRTQLLKKYSSKDPGTWGVPLQQLRMTRAGYINGFPLPLSLAENLDDPRSPHCRMNRPGGWDEFAAYSARMRKFSGPEEYGRWITADAQRILETPVAQQLDMFEPSTIAQIKAKLGRGARKLKRIMHT